MILEGIVLSWSTDGEDSSISSYVLKRYNCSDPATCSGSVTTISKSGTCGTTESYSYTDYPPAPIEQWAYTVEIWKSNGDRACAIDVQPQ